LAGSLIQAYCETDQNDKGGVSIIYIHDFPNASGVTMNTLIREMKSNVQVEWNTMHSIAFGQQDANPNKAEYMNAIWR